MHRENQGKWKFLVEVTKHKSHEPTDI